MRRSRVALLAIATSAPLALGAGPSAGAAIGGGGGFDWYSGPGGERSGTALGFAAWSGRRASLALGILRFDHNLVGAGGGVLGALGAPLGAAARLRVLGTRCVGDGSFRSWRVKAGPEFDLGRDRTLGLYLLRDDTSLGGVTAGGSAELGAPITAGLTGRLGGGIAALPGEIRALQGTLGLTWAPRPQFEITADAGLARNGAVTGAPLMAGAPRGGLPGLPLLDQEPGPPPRSDRQPIPSRTERLLALGVRGYFP